MDPFVLEANPRLISAKGSTIVNLSGYGFVQMEESKSVVSMFSEEQQLTCATGPDQKCKKSYTVFNEHQTQVGTFPQSEVTVGSENIEWRSWNIYLMDPDGVFSPNSVHLFYYKDLELSSVNAQFLYANQEKPIIIQTEFNWGHGNDFETFRKSANLTCRFRSEDL